MRMPIPAPGSIPAMLTGAADAIVAALNQATSACILAGILVARAGHRAGLQKVIDASGLPFATMFMGKSVLDESQPAYAGMYDGALMNEEVRKFVEGRDQIVSVGAPMTDFNTGAFTARLDPAKTITIGHHRTQVNGTNFTGVEMNELLDELARRLPQA